MFTRQMPPLPGWYCFAAYYLISWIEEDAVSTVPSKSIANDAGGRLEPGCFCQVQSSGKVYEAKVIASGTINSLHFHSSTDPTFSKNLCHHPCECRNQARDAETGEDGV